MASTDDIVSYLREQDDLLADWVKTNRDLAGRIANFLDGKRRLLVIAGEPANGKSLMLGQLILCHRRMYRALAVEPPPLLVILYDQVHSVFRERLSSRTRRDITTPAAETYLEARRLISLIMYDIVSFSLRYLSENALILLEAPLYGHRGESALQDLLRSPWSDQVQVLVMFSPGMRALQLEEGDRQSEKSGQPPAIREIRRSLLATIEGDGYPVEQEDEAVKQFWLRMLESVEESMLVSWDPGGEHKAPFEATKTILANKGIRPDTMFPSVLSCYLERIADSVLETIPDLDAFTESFVAYPDDPW